MLCNDGTYLVQIIPEKWSVKVKLAQALAAVAKHAFPERERERERERDRGTERTGQTHIR